MVQLGLLNYLFKTVAKGNELYKKANIHTFTSFDFSLSKTATLSFCKVVW